MHSKKEKLFQIISFMLTLIMQLLLFVPTTVMADSESSIFDSSFPFITNVTLTDTDTGKILGGTDVTGVSKNDHVSMTYDFEIPNGKSVPKGTTYSITIPKEIGIYNELTNVPLNDAEGKTVAYLNMGTDGEGTLTFTDYASIHSNVGGTFTITGYFNKDNISNTTPVTIPFVVEGKTEPYTVDVYFSQPAAVNTKSAIAYDAAKGIITWQVQLNTNKTTIINGIFTDDITPGHTAVSDKSETYVDSSFKVTASDSTVLYDSSKSSGNSGTFVYTPADAGDTSKTGTISYTFTGTFSDTYTVTYQTKLSDPSQYFGGKTVSNTAVFSHNSINQNISGSYTVKTPNYIVKNGKYNTSTREIDWSVMFNGDGLSLHNVHITDPLTNGQTLDTTSVKLDGELVSEGSVTGTFSYNTSSFTLDYNAGDITSAHVLTFSTNLPSNYWQKNHSSGEFSNTATMTADDNAYLQGGAPASKSGVGPGNSVISKTSTGYDYNSHRITWQIIINASNDNLPDAVVTDTIPKGQKYIPETFSITQGAPENGSYGYAFSGTLPEDPSSLPTILTYDLGTISTSYTITYQTELTNPSTWASNSNVNYSNSVSLNPGGGNPVSNWTGTCKVNPNVITKSAAEYNYVTHEIQWKIVVDQSQIPLTNAIVTDNLTGGGLADFTLEPSTIKINDVEASSDSNNPPSANSYYYDDTAKKLVFNLGDLDDSTASNRTKTITFTMKLNKTGEDYDTYFGSNGDRTITNTASLTTNEDPSPTNSSAQQKIHNTLVGKTGYYKSGMAYIDWAVEIDQNKIQLDGLKLTDILQQGLELDTSSVKLYQQNLNPDGSYTPSPVYDSSTGNLNVSGTSITLTKDNISYDASTRTFVFTMPDQVTSPYLLTFRTTVDAAYSTGHSFTNSISFNGGTSGQQGTSTGQPVGFSSFSGTAWGETTNVIVSKVDSSSGNGISGAVFGLYDSYGNLIRLSDSTDDSGSTVFSHINYEIPYTVKEYAAPANYELCASSYSFEVDSSGEIQMLDSSLNPVGGLISSLPAFKDDKKVANVTMVKTGDNNLPLSGASFRLCDIDGNPISGYPTVTTDETGMVVFSNIPYGSYELMETAAPIGYSKLTVPFILDDTNTSIITNGTGHSLDLGNQEDAPSGSITVNKSGCDYQGGPATSLSNVKFEIISRDNEQVIGQSQTTDANGQTVFQDIPVGNYRLHEISAPSDYSLIEDYNFTISASDSAAARQLTVNLKDVKKAGVIKFEKTDGTNPLLGAQFTLYDSTGKYKISNADGYITAISDETGLVQFTNVPYGDYMIKETSAPNNYMIINPLSASLHDAQGGLLDIGIVSDNLLTGTIKFIKTNGSNALSGAEFTLSGNGITRTAVSDITGIVQFTDVPYSDNPYTISETTVPAPYYSPVSEFAVKLNYETADSNGAVFLQNPVVDNPLGSTSVIKTDANGGAPLSGAVFEIYNSNNVLIATSTPTGNDGTAVFENLILNPTGATAYRIHEKTAPLNYDAAPDKTIVLYNEDGLRAASGVVFSDVRKTGIIKISKADDSGMPLQGAVFTLYDASGKNPVQINEQNVTAVSNSYGEADFSGIPYGSYTVKETAAPADYLISNQTVAADLLDTNPNVNQNVLTLSPVTDAIKTASITFNKVTGSGSPLSGAVFALYDSTGNKPVEVDGDPVTAVSAEDGKVTFSSIPYGNYKIVETTAPADYATINPVDISLHDANSKLVNGVFNLGNISDELKTGTISFTKLDETGKGLSGAVFVLKNSGGVQVGTEMISDKDGLVTFTSVPYGDGYSITETRAPADYSVLKAPITGISLHAPSISLQSVSDSRLLGTLSFTKVDEYGKPLSGAEFTLYSKDGSIVGMPEISDKSGQVTFSNVPFSDGYVLKETKAPKNYAIHDNITMNLHTASYNYGKVVDKLLRGTIKVIKTDYEGHALSGSIFALYNSQGKILAKTVSDKSGVALFINVPLGNYSVREIKAPQGYNIDNNYYKVSLDDNTSTATVKVVDVKLSSNSKVTNPKTGSTFPFEQTCILAIITLGFVVINVIYMKYKAFRLK